jgi:histidinol-phosphate/aromatic aminotransferase/cobyric acid decarboxylase-like protein
MPTSNERLNQILAEAGVSKIVYALVMPETESTIDSVLGSDATEARELYHNAFREAWTQKQDAVHESFFDRWLEWTKPIVQLNANDFPYRYPIAGASEGLRESIHAYGARARVDRFEPTIHVFEGEYEGYAAYANAAGITVKTHVRSKWKQTLDGVGSNDQWYISQPSGIDGNVWSELNQFIDQLNQTVPTAQVMLDLSYVGCVARQFTVNADHPNIMAIFFSLSKPAGMYYHRIGGMWSRQSYQGLFGNKWFKNVSSLLIGNAFMSRYGVSELPQRYAANQQAVIDALRADLKLNLRPADVVLLGIGQPSAPASELERFLLRGPKDDALVRVCLTARMANQIDPKLTPRVKARYYENLGE